MQKHSKSVQTAVKNSIKLSYRRDIDGLRAVAVIAIVAFHAFPSLIAARYLMGISSVVNQNYLNLLLQKISLCFPAGSAEKPQLEASQISPTSAIHVLKPKTNRSREPFAGPGTIRSQKLIQVLEKLLDERGYPLVLRSDNGPEFVSLALLQNEFMNEKRFENNQWKGDRN